nr:MAG TPA: tail assembly chaperone protein [Caudoviricetes sp.]
MDPKHVTINGSEYVIGRLDCFQALNVARLASPVIPYLFSGVIKAFLELWKEKGEQTPNEDFGGQLAMALSCAQPLFDRLAQMPKKDFNEILAICLSCVEKKRGKTFGPVVNEGVPYDDVGSADVLRLALEVVVREIRPIGAALFGMASEQKP